MMFNIKHIGGEVVHDNFKFLHYGTNSIHTKRDQINGERGREVCNIHSFFVNGFINNPTKLKDRKEWDNSAIHARTHDSITTRKAS